MLGIVQIVDGKAIATVVTDMIHDGSYEGQPTKGLQ